MNLSKNQAIASEIIQKLKISKGTFDSWVTRGKFDDAIISRRGENGARGHIFDYDKVVQIIRDTTTVAIQAPSPATSKTTAPEAQAEAISSEKITPTNSPSYNTSKAVREAYMAQLAKLDFEERSRKLVDAKKTKRIFFNAARTVRNNLLAIPGRLAAEITGLTDDKEVEQLIMNEILMTLEDLQNVTLTEA